MKKEKGSLTVEACLSLTIFLMVFMTIMYMVRIVFAYEIVQHSLNQVAKEFSTYTYYYAVSGLGDINKTIQNSTAAGNAQFNENVSNVVNVYTEFGNLGSGLSSVKNSVQSGDIESTINNLSSISSDVESFNNALGAAKGTLKSIGENPVAAIKSIGGVLLNGGNEVAKTRICGEIARALMAKYIEDGGYEKANLRLKNLRIVDGLDGLDFSGSEFWSDGSDVRITVCYTIDPIFPIKIVDEINLMNTVKVRGWSAESLF